MATEIDFLLSWLGGNTMGIPNFMIPAGICFIPVVIWLIKRGVGGDKDEEKHKSSLPSAKDYLAKNDIPIPVPTNIQNNGHSISLDDAITHFVISAFSNSQKDARLDGIVIEIYSQDNVLKAKIRDGLIGKITVMPPLPKVEPAK